MTKKTNWSWVVSPSIVILIGIFGFNYARGKTDQISVDTAKAVSECKNDIKDIRSEQGVVNKEMVTLLQQVKIELAELKTEMKIMNRRRD